MEIIVDTPLVSISVDRHDHSYQTLQVRTALTTVTVLPAVLAVLVLPVTMLTKA